MKPSYEKELLAALDQINLNLFNINQTLMELRNDEDNNGQSLRFGPAEPAFPAQEPTP